MKFLKVFTLRLYKIMFWLLGKCFHEKYDAEVFREKFCHLETAWPQNG